MSVCVCVCRGIKEPSLPPAPFCSELKATIKNLVLYQKLLGDDLLHFAVN